MYLLEVLWWLLFCTAVGLCIGSFLNAVIYRLPRERSIRDPLWSICPDCGHRIQWFDNLPLLSFLLLRGRCRHCGLPIATRYFLIEASMALIVLMLLDAFFISGLRAGLAHSRFGLTDELASDWPILLAHVVLFACLLPMSAIDLEHYWVDIRFTNFATIVGFALHTIWSPRHSAAWTRPSDAVAAASVLGLVGLVVVWVVMMCRPRVEPEAPGEPPEPESPDTQAGPEAPAVSPEAAAPQELPPPEASPAARPSRLGAWVAGAMLLVTFITLLLDEGFSFELRPTVRVLLPLVMFFAVIVWESTVKRPSDQMIVDAIHEERHTARRTVLWELALLLPAASGIFVGWWLASPDGAGGDAWRTALHARFHIGPWPIAPLQGFATAAAGYIIGGAIGWVVRIAFTLVLGKEAFGSGDIHLMAAAGCVAGWPVVLLGFILTCGLAMVGWLLSLPFKWSRAMPLGPWLSLSFLIVVLFYDAILRWPLIERAITVWQALISGNSQALPGGNWP